MFCKLLERTNLGLIIAIGVIFILGIFLVLVPAVTDLKVETINKVSGIYDEPMYLTFQWIIDDQIQVGKLITMQITISDLPYNSNMTLGNIQIKFDESQLNYWYDFEDERQLKFPSKDLVFLEPNWASNTFESEQFNLRFITPEDISIEYCDENLQKSCHDIDNIIHPAPYDLEDRINSNRIVISMSLVTAALSSIVVWARLKDFKFNSKSD